MEVNFEMTDAESILHVFVPDLHWMCAKVKKYTHFTQMNGDESSKIFFEESQQSFKMLDAIYKQYMWQKDTIKKVHGLPVKNRIFCQVRVQDFGHGFQIEDVLCWTLL